MSSGCQNLTLKRPISALLRSYELTQAGAKPRDALLSKFPPALCSKSALHDR